MRCTRCYEEISQGGAFCPKCGMPVQMQPQHGQQPQYGQQSQYGQQLQYGQQPQYGQQLQYRQQQPFDKKKSSKGIIISVFATLSIVLIALIVILVTRDISDDKDYKETNANVAGEETKDSRTIMIYMIGSDLETKYGSGTSDIEEMMNANLGDDVNLVIQTGGSMDWHTDVIKDGEVQRFQIRDNMLYELESLGKLNMSLGETLTEFIEYAKNEFPAEKYTLVLWDHGGSIPISFGYDEVFNTGLITEADLGKALEAAGVHFESIIMDACNMCTLEVAMAVKDYADYLVAAESVVIGTGLYYTGWLDCIGTNIEVEPVEYCKLIVEEYMDTAERAKSDASMSYIDLAKIGEVYEAYVSYIDSVYSDLEAGYYVDYVQARESCGLYSGTESVDLITLAKKYKTDESLELINAVKNAVGYQESDYVYGNGLAVYSPNEYSKVYDTARESLEILEYDGQILKCYDAFVSLKLAYLGTSYVEQYAGEWYDEKIVRSYIEEETESATYVLETDKVNGRDAICLSDSDWEIMSSLIVQTYVYMNDSTVLLLGQEYYGEIDDDGNIILGAPEYWTRINGYIVSYVCVDAYEDMETGEWMQIGTVFAKVNGEEVLLVLQYSNENPDGRVIGYIPYDFETRTSPDGRARMMLFNDDDEIELIHPIINATNLTISYDSVVEETFLPSELVLTYDKIDYGTYDVICVFEIEDIYGNVYETDEFVY